MINNGLDFETSSSVSDDDNSDMRDGADKSAINSSSSLGHDGYAQPMIFAWIEWGYHVSVLQNLDHCNECQVNW